MAIKDLTVRDAIHFIEKKLSNFLLYIGQFLSPEGCLRVITLNSDDKVSI